MRAPFFAPAILVAAFASVGLLTGASAVMADSPPGDATANAKPPPPDPRIQVTIADQAAVEGSAVGPGIGYVIDPDPRATAAEYAVSVNWGDGSAPESAFLSQTQAGDQGGGTQFSINASHTYTDAGSYFIGVRVIDVDNRFNGASGGAIAVISEAPLTA